ncbi:MAG TPA: 1,2-phenylacetyl-CoA epoxidase subunit PaaC [Gemmatimonadaceae bacterium]|nr:1,2-phenylacetyl-CoA epoxidase subunit PaaC [Gemmatimonadaceae bacterium]
MTETTSSAGNDDVFEYLLRLGDDRLVLGHRLSEWCGHGPILEEDIALANISLDLIGQATLYLGLAGETEGKGRDADSLAYFREGVEFRNLQLVELPKGDFAFTIARQFLFDVFSLHHLEQLQRSANKELAGIASKGYKEVRYHIRHSSEWLQRLGDGTTESHNRAQKALDELWRFTGEMFAGDDVDKQLGAAGVAPDLDEIQTKWRAMVSDVIQRATLSIPSDTFMMAGGRSGRHTEHLGHMLSEMQIVARSHPGAAW